MRSRGSGNKFKRGGPKRKGRNGPKKKPRKTYSLYAKSNALDNTGSNKRKFVDDLGQHHKRSMVSDKISKQKQDDTSESEEEEENPMKKLRETFGNISKKTVAVDSSDEEDDDDEVVSESKNCDEDEDNSDDTSDENEHNLNSDVNNVDVDVEVSNKDNIRQGREDNMNTEPEQEFNEEDEIDIDAENYEDKTANSNDPFALHLSYDLSDSLLESMQQTPVFAQTTSENWPELGKIIFQIPNCEDEARSLQSTITVTENQPKAPKGTIPSRINPLKDATLQNLGIKGQILPHIQQANKSLLQFNDCKLKLPFTPLQSELFSIMNNYQDLYFCNRTFDNAQAVRFTYCLHAVNHILKTRMKVLHHNARLNKKDDDVPEEFRDQGLVRSKILIIVPFKDTAYKIVQTIIDILIVEDKGHVMHKNRFVEDYTGNELVMPKRNPKPEDYEQLFTGNTGDDFKMGITVTKKSLKLYADFYSSDIIIASPLGLRYIIGAQGEPDRDFDFLASIELLIVDQTEIFLMQNWDHLLHIFKHMHMQPKDSHGTNFSRVRTWCLSGFAKYYRQTLIFSSFNVPEINSIFNKFCFNYAGKVKTVNPVLYGSIRQVFVQLPHVFHKFDATSAAAAIDERFEFFTSRILPQQKDSLMKQTMIFVSNYFDYVRLRNYFKREDIGFVQICEYSKEGKVARARDMFFHGDAHFLLYTERFHFFNRVRVKGIRHMVFYQLPLFPHFYYEICNLMQEGYMNRKVGSATNMTVSVIYSKYDGQHLSSVVGSERAANMIQSDKNVHMLVTGAD